MLRFNHISAKTRTGQGYRRILPVRVFCRDCPLDMLAVADTRCVLVAHADIYCRTAGETEWKLPLSAIRTATASCGQRRPCASRNTSTVP
jgi:hypothetical protein